MSDKGEDPDKEGNVGRKKGKGKSKAKDVQQPPDNKRKATDKDPDQTCDVSKMSVFFHLIHIHHHSVCHMSLLSLNESTLYYFFLSDRMQDSKEKTFSTGINHWAASIPDNAKPANKVALTSASRISKLSNRSGSQIPALTNATSRSSNASVLSNHRKC